MQPTLSLVTDHGVTFLTDVTLFAQTGIRVAFSQRHGGVSAAPYATLNVGSHVGDDLDAVLENRSRLCRALGLSEAARRTLNTAQQVHGTAVACALNSAYEFSGTDALVTDREDVGLLLCFADCVPIIVVDPTSRVVGVIHSGWRGTLDGIAAVTIEAMLRTFDVEPSRLLAYIGPFIGLQSFTITSEVARRFFDRFDMIPHHGYQESTGGSVNLDLGIIVEETLARMGVRTCNIINSHIDTVSASTDYFSYRADDCVTGRFGALGCLCSS